MIVAAVGNAAGNGVVEMLGIVDGTACRDEELLVVAMNIFLGVKDFPGLEILFRYPQL